MLSLTRRIRQKVIIGNNIVVTVLGINDKFKEAEVKLGITAPRDVSVHRKEIYDRIKREKAEVNNEDEETKWNR